MIACWCFVETHLLSLGTPLEKLILDGILVLKFGRPLRLRCSEVEGRVELVRREVLPPLVLERNLAHLILLMDALLLQPQLLPLDTQGLALRLPHLLLLPLQLLLLLPAHLVQLAPLFLHLLLLGLELLHLRLHLLCVWGFSCWGGVGVGLG